MFLSNALIELAEEAVKKKKVSEAAIEVEEDGRGQPLVVCPQLVFSEEKKKKKKKTFRTRRRHILCQ